MLGPIKNNPNASVAGGTTGLGVIVVFVLGALGVPVPPEVAVAGVGLVSTAVLVIGRRGIRGIARSIWRGNEDEAGGVGR